LPGSSTISGTTSTASETSKWLRTALAGVRAHNSSTHAIVAVKRRLVSLVDGEGIVSLDLINPTLQPALIVVREVRIHRHIN
jgi:hypothetical protein